VARGALSSIASGQTLASRALGMNQRQTLIRVICPQALKRFIPPYVNQLTLLVHASTLTSVVGVIELLGSTRQMIERLAYVGDGAYSIVIYLGVMLLFFIVCFPLTLIAQALEAKARSE
jgi:polar amino acid transport system permease protein